MSKLVSYDAIFAALAVLAIGGGCAKKDEAPKATAESVPAASPAAPVATTTAAVEPGAVTDTTPAVAIAAVDAGIEARKVDTAQKNAAPPSTPPKPAAAQRKGSAACGAGTCGSDMKK